MCHLSHGDMCHLPTILFLTKIIFLLDFFNVFVTFIIPNNCLFRFFHANLKNTINEGLDMSFILIKLVKFDFSPYKNFILF